MSITHIRDLLYFDFDKAASIWSQFEGGLRERVSITEEEVTERSREGTIGAPGILGAQFSGMDAEKKSILESKVLHHDLLNLLEEKLSKIELVVNLSEKIDVLETSAESIRLTLQNKPYVIAEGWAVIEDYNRISNISERFNDILEFITKGRLTSIETLPEYAKLHQSIEEERDRNKKRKLQSELDKVIKQLKMEIQSEISPIDDWLIDGIKHWIDTFMPNRINLRIYPAGNCPSFQIISNLKRECFVDQDLEHLLYGYGYRPNIKLSVFGLITSLPSSDGSLFDPMKEFEDESILNDETKWEKAFRGVFGGFDGIENFARYSRYPNITVHPIAVFREFNINPE